MSKHLRLLGRIIKIRRNCYHHVDGRHMYTRMPVLLREDLEDATAAGSSRAGAHR